MFLFSFILPYKAVLHDCFLSFILSCWLHHYCIVTLIPTLIKFHKKTNKQQHFHIFCPVFLFFWVAIISHKFLIKTQINAIHSRQEKRRQSHKRRIWLFKKLVFNILQDFI